MPILKEKWYQEAGIKKPELQIKILRCIGLKGRLSKKMGQEETKSDYSDVSNAIDSLAGRKMIRISSLSMKGRRDRKYYALTDKGLYAFINESYSSSKSSSEDFWYAIIWYCIQNPKQTGFSEFEKYCSEFESIYLGHPAIKSYIFQSRFFDKLVKNWLEENGRLDNTISLLQKILECLAINRKITLERLCKMAGESEVDVKKLLSKHTVTIGRLRNPQQDDNNIYVRSETHHPEIDQMLIAKEVTDNQTITYELSLFGVMLTIALIRFHYIGIDNVRLGIFNGPVDKWNLFFKNISLKDYFDKMASNYYDKLPLIFGKWSILKEKLGSIFLYDNFDFLLYDKAFSVNMGNSLWLGGNKEFCDSLQALADKSSRMLKNVYIEGKTILENFYKNELEDEKDEFKLLPVYLKLVEIEAILKYLNNESISNGVEAKGRGLQDKIKPHLDERDLYLDTITFIERVFSKELTFFFYLNLNNSVFTTSDSYSQTSKSSRTIEDKDIPEINLEIAADVFSLGSPQQRLIKILQNNGDIKQEFYTWMKILINFQQETSERMVRNFKIINIEK